MATGKLWFISLVLCNFAPVMMGPKWKVKAPGNLQTFEGSCLVIPCTFEYGNCSEESTPEKGIWFKKMDMEDRKVYDPDSSLILEAFNNRTQLLGNVTDRNCTLQINNINKADAGIYIFRVEGHTKSKKICHYTYTEEPVTITVRTVDMKPVIRMEEVEVGSPATVTCSVNYTCSSDPPDLSWSHKQRGNASLVHSQDEGQWTLTSDLTFQTKDSDLDTWINCTAKYNTLSLLAHQAVMLQLGYPPRIKQESSCADLQCHCLVESKPPSIINWILPNGRTTKGDTNTNGYSNISLSEEDIGAVYCHASNRYGNATMTFRLGSVPILYIVISVFTAVVVFLLAATLALWRYKSQKRQNRLHSLMSNPLYKTRQEVENKRESKQTEIPKNNKGSAKARRPAPPVPEICKQNEDEKDDDYIFPVPDVPVGAQMVMKNREDNIYIVPLENEESAEYCNRHSISQAVISSKSQRRKSRRQSNKITPEVPQQTGESSINASVYNNFRDYDVYANY